MGVAAKQVAWYDPSADGESSSGRTTDSESVNRGSNPRSPVLHTHCCNLDAY